MDSLFVRVHSLEMEEREKGFGSKIGVARESEG